MENLPDWISDALELTGFLSTFVAALATFVTALATFFLWRVTKVLAHETKRMAEASAQPHVVATIIPNSWSMLHFDLHVQNTGNATAYDIHISFDPPLENGEARGDNLYIPFQSVSVLKPGQNLSSYLSEYEAIKGRSYQVQIRWRKNAADQVVEINRYTLNMRDHEGISRLGDDPLVLMAKHVKKLDENWAKVLTGHQRIRVDAFDSDDRARERETSDRAYRRLKERHDDQTPRAGVLDSERQ